MEKRGFELQISGRESKTLPLDHCVIAYRKDLKYWSNQSISPAALLVFLSFLVPNHSLLANFSQFPPLCANFHPYSTHLHPLRQLFFVYDFLVIPCSLFENILFWLYFWNPWVIFIFFCGRLIYFLSIFLPLTYIFCTFVQTQEKKIPLLEIWDLGQNPTSIFNFSYK